MGGLGRHQRVGAVGRQRPARLTERLDDRVVVVEPEVTRVVRLGAERDAFRGQRALECRQVERLVVGDDAVEVEHERARPPGHGRLL